MKIKKYIASTLKEGKNLIIEDLGGDAIILSNRTYTDKDGQVKYEIVAAIDQRSSKPSPPEKIISHSKPGNSISGETVSEQGTNNASNFDITARILGEINNINQKIENISDNMRYKFTGKSDYSGEMLYKQLRKSGFSEDFSDIISAKIAERKLDDPKKIIEFARQQIIGQLKISEPFQKEDKRKVICFIGPTGSGKTLSLVKLAVVAKLVMAADTFLISADTHKVGGSDQLQTYSTIAGIPFESVYTPEEIEAILARERNRDFIFLDTVGRNPRNQRQINDLIPYLRAARPDLTFYVCSATKSYNNIVRSIDDFSEAGISSIILTKLDETYEPGIVIEAMKNCKYPLAYTCSGQQIPDDIEPADRESLSGLLFDKDFEEEFIKKFSKQYGKSE